MVRDRSGLRRREFLKAGAASGDGGSSHFNFLETARLWAETASPALSKALANVKPEIGTGWRGHMFAGPVAPFGLVQVSPDTAGPPERRWNARGDFTGWNHCSGYHYSDNVVMGFSHTHVQGTGASDLGDVLLMPVIEGRNWSFDAGIPQDLAEMQIEELGMNTGWVFDKEVPGYRSFARTRKRPCAPVITACIC